MHLAHRPLAHLLELTPCTAQQDGRRLLPYSRARLPPVWPTQAFSNWFPHLTVTSLRDGKESGAAVPGGFGHGLRQRWVAALQNDPLFARTGPPTPTYAGVDPP